MAYSTTPSAPAAGSTLTADGVATIAGLVGTEASFVLELVDAAGNVVARTSALNPFGTTSVAPGGPGTFAALTDDPHANTLLAAALADKLDKSTGGDGTKYLNDQGNYAGVDTLTNTGQNAGTLKAYLANKIGQNGLLIDNELFGLADLLLQASTGTLFTVRYETRPAYLFSAANTSGELQFFNSSNPTGSGQKVPAFFWAGEAASSVSPAFKPIAATANYPAFTDQDTLNRYLLNQSGTSTGGGSPAKGYQATYSDQAPSAA